MTKRKPNISPSLIGELFLKPGEDIPYRLILCNTEPTAQIQRVDRTAPDDLVGISGLSGLVLLKPERPIVKPKKIRADKGWTHRKPKNEQSLTLEDIHKAMKQLPQEEIIHIDTLNKEGKRKAKEIKDSLELADKKGDNLTIHVPTGLKGDTKYCVNIAGYEAKGDMLRETVMRVLEEWSGKVPDELSSQERATIQGILDAGGGLR